MATKTSTVSGRVFKRVLFLASILAAVSCGAGFDSPDWVKSLRVLGVRKDKPYAPPTTDPANPSQVNLTMLDYDGTYSPNPPQRLWFSGCNNLPGDQYFTCLAYMNILWQKWKVIYPDFSPDAVLKVGESWSPGDPGVFSDEDVVKIVSDVMVVPGLIQQITPEIARANLVNFRIGWGERFTYTIPLGIENRQASSDPTIPRYGLGFVFFTDCIGHIDTAPNWQNVDIATILHNAVLGFPFVCLDDNGNALGPDDFVSGYTQVFVPSDGTVNNNPTLKGVRFNGKDLDLVTDGVPAGTAVGAETDAGASADAGTDAGSDAGAGTTLSPGAKAFCIDEGCVPLPALDPCADSSVPKSRHVNRCSGKCSTYEFSPTLDETIAANNDSGLFEAQKGKRSPTGEQMWVDYYTDRGTLKHEVRLLRDANLPWGSTDFSNQWTPPAEAGPVNLWAVAHDTRGGTGWVRLQICVD